MHLLKESLAAVYSYLVKQADDASHQMTLFGLVMMINYPLFGVFWKMESFQRSDEFYLRLVATLLCALLAFYKFWPSRFLKFLPVFWYLVLFFCLPFFFCYLTILNHASTLWLMNCVSAIFFLLLVTSVLGSLVLLFLGVGLSFLTFYMSHHVFDYIPGNISLFSLFVTFTAAIIIGALFARDREIIQEGRLTGMRTLAGSIAHDLRTPLASIHLQAELQEIILNKLNNSEVQKDLKESLSKIIRGIETSNQLIRMQLNHIQQEKLDTGNFTIYSIAELVENTLEEYPLKDNQKHLIRFNPESDFSIWIGETAFKNLIWNLLKNSLAFIDELGKGDIEIWLGHGDNKDNFNYLHVRDTAKGLDAKDTEKIFEHFYTEKKDGTGIGLSYCRLLMHAAGGEIYSKGKINEFAHFILKFPKID